MRGETLGDPGSGFARVALEVEGAILVTANLDDMTRVPDLQVEDWARD